MKNEHCLYCGIEAVYICKCCGECYCEEHSKKHTCFKINKKFRLKIKLKSNG